MKKTKQLMLFDFAFLRPESTLSNLIDSCHQLSEEMVKKARKTEVPPTESVSGRAQPQKATHLLNVSLGQPNNRKHVRVGLEPRPWLQDKYLVSAATSSSTILPATDDKGKLARQARKLLLDRKRSSQTGIPQAINPPHVLPLNTNSNSSSITAESVAYHHHENICFPIVLADTNVFQNKSKAKETRALRIQIRKTKIVRRPRKALNAPSNQKDKGLEPAAAQPKGM